MSGKPDITEQTVRRRRVFYIPGYDPIHPRRYRELYRKESGAQAAISGYEITLSPKTTKGPYGWHVSAIVDGQETQTDVEALVWSDIVRDSMSHTIPATYSAMLRTAWAYIGSGALWRLMRLRKGPVIAALYPVLMLIVQALLALGAAWGVMRGVSLLLGFVPELAGLGPYVGLVLGLGVAWGLLAWFKKQDAKFFVYYLMHDYSYSARHSGANPPELEARMAEFGAAIAEALTQDFDEVLVVGHSSGAHLGCLFWPISFARGRCPRRGPCFRFCRLGRLCLWWLSCQMRGVCALIWPI